MQMPVLEQAAPKGAHADWRAIARSAWAGANSSRASSAARRLVPVLFGLWSLALGADANWDLQNYHLYNPFALLHGKLAIDFAPAGLQTYFNPLADLPYYLLSQVLVAPVVGLTMGAIHGLNFILLLAIARSVLADVAGSDANRIALLAAGAGCLTPHFLSELGNTMGDNLTALFVLGSLLIVLLAWRELIEGSRHGVGAALVAGAVAGLGVGLKLTNGPYAVALAAALLAVPTRAGTRLRLALGFAGGAIAGVATSGGYWLVEMWRTFHNPLFPQFTNVFPNPLARDVGIVDDRFGPKGWLEAVLWPLAFAADSRRVGQITVHQLVWPFWYVFFWAWLLVSAVRTAVGQRANAMTARCRFLTLFVAGGYALWMAIFAYGRYLVPIELLAPLVSFVLLGAILPGPLVRPTWGFCVGLATLLVLAGGYRAWDHRDWGRDAFHAEVPLLSDPDRSTVVLAGGDPPRGWIATQFPPTVAFVQLGGNFPAGPAFAARIRDTVKGRGGPTFAILVGHRDARRESIASTQALLTRIGVTTNPYGCAATTWLVQRFRMRPIVRRRTPESPDGSRSPTCELVLRPGEARDIARENALEQEKSLPLLTAYGLALDRGSCAPYRAWIGSGVEIYQWCRVSAS